jgi:hypothetical protein
MELRGVKVGEPVCRSLQCIRCAEIAGKVLAVFGLALAAVRHVRCDIDQSHDRGIVAGLGNHRAAVAVSHENARSVLLCDNPFRGSDVFLKRGLGLLYDADGVAVLDQDVVHPLPTRTICPRTMHEHDVPNWMWSVLRRECTPTQQAR